MFITTRLVKIAEEMTTARGGAPGRPTAHATCLILAMLAIKSILGVGYRETDRLFREAGYPNLPDFRTIQWRSERLRKKRLHMSVGVRNGRYENTVLLDVSENGEFVSTKEMNNGAWSRAMRNIKRNFVEIML